MSHILTTETARLKCCTSEAHSNAVEPGFGAPGTDVVVWYYPGMMFDWSIVL